MVAHWFPVQLRHELPKAEGSSPLLLAISFWPFLRSVRRGCGIFFASLGAGEGRKDFVHRVKFIFGIEVEVRTILNIRSSF